MRSETLSRLIKNPIPLKPDNFTPPSRTPWGGTFIGRDFKKALCPEYDGSIIGESWEFSCDPSFPSRLLGSSLTLQELITQFPKETLSPAFNTCEILVKILDAQDNLSVQVHPADSDPFLTANECGKPESWLVLDAAPGAGIYLGFSKPVTKEKLQKYLEEGLDLSPLLQFVPVHPGDYFETPAGICHAIGKGVSLIEPQRVVFGKTGKTYRLWDWNRTYNKEGLIDPKGSPRQLHIKEAMRIINPDQQWGQGLLTRLKSQALIHEGDGFRIESFGSNPYYKLDKIDLNKGSDLKIANEKGYGAMIPLEGSFSIRASSTHETYWQKGQSAFLPFASFPLSFHALEKSRFIIVKPV